jgi:hypothetical protein
VCETKLCSEDNPEERDNKFLRDKNVFGSELIKQQKALKCVCDKGDKVRTMFAVCAEFV